MGALDIRVRKWGWVKTVYFALGVAIIVGILLLFFGPLITDVTPLSDDETEVPAIGEEGYNTAQFCDDKLTEITYKPIPDGGKLYQLLRVKDGIQESVVWNDAAPSGTYFGDRDRPAHITDKARTCIENKGKPFIERQSLSNIPGAVGQTGHPDVFQCGTGCDMQLLNPVTQSAKADHVTTYRMITMPGCNSGTMYQDFANMDAYVSETVGLTMLRVNTGYEYTVRVNCGNGQITTCGSIFIFCLGRGFPYSPDIDMSDILSAYTVESKLAIPLHEVVGHAHGTWDEKYCKGPTDPRPVCIGKARFDPAPNQVDFMNTGADSRVGFTKLTLDRWAATMWSLTQVCNSNPCYDGRFWQFSSGWGWEPATDCWWYGGRCFWQRADAFGWRASPVAGIALPSGQVYYHIASGQHLLVP